MVFSGLRLDSEKSDSDWIDGSTQYSMTDFQPCSWKVTMGLWQFTKCTSSCIYWHSYLSGTTLQIRPWTRLGCTNAPPGCPDANPATLVLIPGSYSLFTFARLRMYIPSLEPCTSL